jgi:D-alanyl-D-alanine dipeptidase
VKLLAILGVLAACSHESRREEPPPPPKPPPKATSVIPDAAPQLLTAVVDDWTATHATLRLFHRDGAAWTPSGPAWAGVIGKTGAAWGDGLHGDGPPAGQPGPRKREGDGKSPAGAFAVRATYGYAATATSKLPYTPVTASWQCVDDPASSHYATILDRASATVDWKSAEQMRRDDVLYTWVVDLAHNPARTPNDGSCIFLHVWSGPDSTTVGCTAMDEGRLRALIAELDPHAVYVLLPAAAYDALAPAWHLPQR